MISPMRQKCSWTPTRLFVRIQFVPACRIYRLGYYDLFTISQPTNTHVSKTLWFFTQKTPIDSHPRYFLNSFLHNFTIIIIKSGFNIKYTTAIKSLLSTLSNQNILLFLITFFYYWFFFTVRTCCLLVPYNRPSLF